MMTFDDNLLALGSCIAGFGLLVTGLLALLFRHPNAPRWSRPEIVPMLVCVPVTAITGLGLGYAAYGLSQLLAGGGDPRDLLALAGVLIGLVLVWRALGIRRRLKSYGAATGGAAASAFLAAEPTLGIDEEPPPRPQPRPGSSRTAAQDLIMKPAQRDGRSRGIPGLRPHQACAACKGDKDVGDRWFVGSDQRC